MGSGISREGGRKVEGREVESRKVGSRKDSVEFTLAGDVWGKALVGD